MNLYRWPSEALEGYYDGDIIVMATSIERARRKASLHIENTMPGVRPAAFERDLSNEPEIVKCGVILILGGD